MNDLIEILEEFGNKFIEAEYKHFNIASEDNGEYIPRIERFTKICRGYLKEKNINEKEILELEIILIKKAENLFVSEWVRQVEEESIENDINEERNRAIKTFYSYIKEKKYK